MSKWVKRWEINSRTKYGSTHTVAMDAQGNFGCSCPVWKFKRRECHHILAVKNNLFINLMAASANNNKATVNQDWREFTIRELEK